MVGGCDGRRLETAFSGWRGAVEERDTLLAGPRRGEGERASESGWTAQIEGKDKLQKALTTWR